MPTFDFGAQSASNMSIQNNQFFFGQSNTQSYSASSSVSSNAGGFQFGSPAPNTAVSATNTAVSAPNTTSASSFTFGSAPTNAVASHHDDDDMIAYGLGSCGCSDVAPPKMPILDEPAPTSWVTHHVEVSSYAAAIKSLFSKIVPPGPITNEVCKCFACR